MTCHCWKLTFLLLLGNTKGILAMFRFWTSTVLSQMFCKKSVCVSLRILIFWKSLTLYSRDLRPMKNQSGFCVNCKNGFINPPCFYCCLLIKMQEINSFFPGWMFQVLPLVVKSFLPWSNFHLPIAKSYFVIIVHLCGSCVDTQGNVLLQTREKLVSF